jgi:hypothetical protein
MTPPRYTPFTAEIAGRKYSGTWHIEGKSVHVSSAYGSASAPLGRAKPENVAARVLQTIVGRRR